MKCCRTKPLSLQYILQIFSYFLLAVYIEGFCLEYILLLIAKEAVYVKLHIKIVSSLLL